MQSCYKCGALDDDFIFDRQQGQIVCQKCGYVQGKIPDETLETRLFNDAASSKKKDRQGTLINKKTSDDKARLVVLELTTLLGVDKEKGMQAINVYKEYQQSAQPFKSLKSRPLSVVIAACMFCALCMNDTGINLDMHPNKRLKLDEYCEERGKNKKTSAFEQQLDDILKYVKFENLVSVEKYIQEVRVRLNWPDYIARNVLLLRKVLIEHEKQFVPNRMDVQQYTAMLYYIMTQSFDYKGKVYRGFMQDKKPQIFESFVVTEDFIKQSIEQLNLEEKRDLIAEIFDKVNKEKDD